jgi:4-diphosphocytidyl-2-C-methyl-D-erythritol kinase
LNLGLRVLGLRDDGYHLLESLFVPLELADRLRLEMGKLEPAASGRAVEIGFEMVAGKDLPAGSSFPEASENLAVRAARAFLEAAGVSGSLSIRLEKSIPIGAGLGGGSSDAGAVLRVLRDQHPGAVSPDALLGIAARLGADVPFFLTPEPSVVRGIGEQIAPLEGLPELWILLVNPGVPLATAEVFAGFDRETSALTLDRTRSTMRALKGLSGGSRAQESLSKAFDSGLLENDLEAAATRLCPAVGFQKERLGDLGARWSAMSGSGATVYGVFADEAEARSALERGRFEAPIWACVTRVQRAWKS